MAGKPVRVLSIDGGGVRGVIPAVFLGRIQALVREKHRQSLTECFDFVAGTSTGAVIAAGVAIGVSVDRLLRLYRERAREIFPYQRRWSPQRLGLILQYGLSAPKYDADPLKAVLKSVLGRRTVGSVDNLRLLIPFYDTLQRETQFIKNYPDPHNPSPRFEPVPLWEAALCSASAPTFFPAHRLKIGDSNMLRLQFDLSKRWGGAAPNDDLDDASPENLAALQTAATAYIGDPATDARLREFLT